MTLTPKIQASFNGGEISSRMRGRVDQAAYANGLAEMVGYLPAIEGPAIAASGTYYVAEALGPCRLIPFEFNVTQGYVIEASAGTFRFYTNDALISGYSIAAPWTYAQLLELNYEQSADVLYLVHRDVPMQKLSRLTATTFALAAVDLKNGPFDDNNSDETVTVTPSNVTGAITLTASSGIFEASDVGGYFRLEAIDFSDIKAWEPAAGPMNVGDLRRWDNKVYELTELSDTSKQRTGSVPPTHHEGEEWDGTGGDKTGPNDVNLGGVKWKYLYDTFGIAKITAFTSATQVSATVTRRLPFSAGGTATWHWAFGAFSTKRGWPTCVTIWNERLTLAKDSTVYASVVGDYENFSQVNDSGEVSADMAIKVTLPNPNFIRWLAADKKLMIGTARAEHTAGPASSSSAVGPTNIAIETETTIGSAQTRPILADGRVLFIQKARRKLLEMAYELESDRFEAPDMTRFARHISKSPFIELAWAQEPERLLWAVREDGALVSMTYSPREQVLGWARRLLATGLLAKSICTISDPAGEAHQLWIAATLDGDWKVLRMAPQWEEGSLQANAFLVDAGKTRTGLPTQTITGLSHLEGKTVQVLVDGAAHPDRIVSGGAITLDAEASTVHVGLGYPAWIRTLPPADGQGRVKRIPRLTLRLSESLGLRVTTADGVGKVIEHRTPADVMGAAVPLFSGDVILENVGAFERTAQVLIERLQPLPSTIAAILPDIAIGQQ